MLKRNVILYTLFLVLSSSLLFACTSETTTSDYALIRPGIYELFGISEDGVLFVESGTVWFHDFEAEEKVIVCNLPDCDHEPFHHTTNPDPICLATNPVEGHIEAVGMYDDDIYMFVHQGSEESIIYQIDLERSNRKEIASFNWGINDIMNEFVIEDGMAYLPVKRFIVEEGSYRSSGSEFSFISIDLNTGETTQYGEVKNDNYAGVSNFKKIEDKLYFTYNYLDYEGEFDFFDEEIDRSQYQRHYLYELDINTNEERIALDLTDLDGSLHHFNEDHLYILSEDQTEITTLDWSLEESDVLLTGEGIGVSAIFNDGIIYTQHRLFDGSFYYYDFKSQETQSFTRPVDEFSAELMYDDWIFFKANFKDSQVDLVMLKFDDYLAGETDYIYLDAVD